MTDLLGGNPRYSAAVIIDYGETVAPYRTRKIGVTLSL